MQPNALTYTQRLRDLRSNRTYLGYSVPLPRLGCWHCHLHGWWCQGKSGRDIYWTFRRWSGRGTDSCRRVCCCSTEISMTHDLLTLIGLSTSPKLLPLPSVVSAHASSRAQYTSASSLPTSPTMAVRSTSMSIPISAGWSLQACTS